MPAPIIGVSKKVHAATLAPLAGGLIVALVNYTVTGQFDGTSVASVIAGSSGGLVSGVIGYIVRDDRLRTAVQDGAAIVGAVEHTHPELLDEVKGFVTSELAKVPAALQPVLHAIEADVVDPILEGVAVESTPGELRGDAGQPSAIAPPDVPQDPRDATIAALRAQLAALQAPQGPVITSAGVITGSGVTTGVPS